jgi:hypothetical protein
MDTELKLIYPTVYLYLSDLRGALGESDSQRLERSKKFYWKFRYDSTKNHDYNEKRVIEFQKKESPSGMENLMQEEDHFPPTEDGFFQPTQIDDTYFLTTCYSGNKIKLGESDYQPRSLKNLGDKWDLPKEKLNREKNSATLGETWIYRAQLVNPTDRPKDVAKEIYDKLIVDNSHEAIWDENKRKEAWEKDLKNGGQGIWQGGYIYELWHKQQNPSETLEQEIQQNPHILIWLFPCNIPPESVSKIAENNNNHLLHLCHHRHKILATAYDSYQYGNDLKKDYATIIDYLRDIKQGNISDRQLKNILLSLADFTYRLDVFISQSHTIKTNKDNYSSRLDEMEMAAVGVGNDLKFFTTFLKKVHKYQDQIAADYKQLAPSREILQTLSQTVQGIIQINQTKVSHTTNITIASIAAGIAASQLLAALIPNHTKAQVRNGFVKDIQQYTPLLLADPNLYVSLGLSLFFGMVMFIVLRWVPSFLRCFPDWLGKLLFPKR